MTDHSEKERVVKLYRVNMNRQLNKFGRACKQEGVGICIDYFGPHVHKYFYHDGPWSHDRRNIFPNIDPSDKLIPFSQYAFDEHDHADEVIHKAKYVMIKPIYNRTGEIEGYEPDDSPPAGWGLDTKNQSLADYYRVIMAESHAMEFIKTGRQVRDTDLLYRQMERVRRLIEEIEATDPNISRNLRLTK
jgi:hypothetical protein